MEKLRNLGWVVVEFAVIVVVFCVLADIIAGPMAGSVVTSIAVNANRFLAGLPSGTLIGLLGLCLAWIVVRRRFGS